MLPSIEALMASHLNLKACAQTYQTQSKLLNRFTPTVIQLLVEHVPISLHNVIAFILSNVSAQYSEDIK